MRDLLHQHLYASARSPLRIDYYITGDIAAFPSSLFFYTFTSSLDIFFLPNFFYYAETYGRIEKSDGCKTLCNTELSEMNM